MQNITSSIYHTLKLAKTSFTKTKTVSFAMTRQVRIFQDKEIVRIFQDKEIASMIMYDSGADDHYLSKRDPINIVLPILRPSTK